MAELDSDNDGAFRLVWQIAAAVWFVTLSVLVIIPSCELLDKAKATTTAQAPPALSPRGDTVGLGQYTAKLEAYNKYLVAYASYTTNALAARHSAYELVVKNTLVALISSFLTSLLAFVFAKEGANLVRAYFSKKY